jgi:hypothetical protein
MEACQLKARQKAKKAFDAVHDTFQSLSDSTRLSELSQAGIQLMSHQTLHMEQTHYKLRQLTTSLAYLKETHQDFQKGLEKVVQCKETLRIE